MKITAKKSILASVILLALGSQNAQANTMCGVKTTERQGVITANQTECITDYGHYFYVTVPYENSNVTITTSGGTYSGTDAGIVLYSGDSWNSSEEEAQSMTPDTNDESLSFVSRAGQRYFRISGNIAETSLLVSVTGGDVPLPMGDYFVYDTNIAVNLPAPTLTSKAQYGSVIGTILTAAYADFEAIAAAPDDPISDVAAAVHYLAHADNIADPDLNQLLYFLGSYKYYALAMTDSEAAALSTALQAVATMTGFLGADGGAIQEGYAKALNNFERNAGAAYYPDQLPHLLALIQHYSIQTNPFATGNAGDSTMAALSSLASAAYYGDSPVKAAFTDNMLAVLSVMRSFAFLGETSLDNRWSGEADKKWIMPHTFNALGKIATMATDEAKARLDSIILEVHDKVVLDISIETTQTIIINGSATGVGTYTYDVTVTDGNGCVGTAAVTLTI
ncbi:MAG: collagenase, partial [Algicola sp.]|nr:collagenase [Algicola sp.]